MECVEAFGRLSAWLDGELEPAEAREVEAHVAGCESCRRRRELLAAASQAVRGLSPETVSEGFDDRLRQRLIAEATARRRRGVRFPMSLVAMGAAAVLLVAILGKPRGRDVPPLVGSAAAARTVRAVPRPAFDCRPDLVASCRTDGPCATARSCGAWPIAAAVPAGPRP
jgi:anti-sigma factor RsiW